MKTDTKERLIETASKLFAERGFDGASVRDIVRSCGVNLGAVTYHFGSKEGLFAAVVARKIEPFQRIGEEILRSKGSPEERLRLLLVRYASRVLREDPTLKVFFSEVLAGASRLPRVAVESVAFRNRIFADIVKDGVRQGVFRECDVECAAWSFFGMMSAYILYAPLISKGRRQGAFPKAYTKRVIDAALDIFLRGIMVRGEKTTSRRAGGKTTAG